MRKALSAAAAALLLAFAACGTEPATDVDYDSAALHAKVGCTDTVGAPTGYDAQWRFAYRKVGAGTWSTAPWHSYSCPDETAAHYLTGSPFAETVSDLDHDSEYEYRVEFQHVSGAAFEWRDKDDVQNGTSYDTFETDTFPTVTAKTSQSLLDSIGINTRTAYSDAHGNLTEVHDALDYMGIRHIRDSLWPAAFTAQRDFLVELAEDGITATLSPHYFGTYTINPCAYPNIAEFVSRLENDADLRAVVERIDSTNEPSNDTAWQTCQRTYQEALWDAVKGSTELADREVLAPSAFANSTTLGDIDEWVDFGNFHPYPSAFPPESESGAAAVQWNIDNVCKTHTDDPCQATEWGYHTDLSQTGSCVSPTWQNCHKGVNESTRATYTLRGILDFYRRGIVRTDLYTIVSGTCNSRSSGTADSSDFGFYDCNWNPFQVADAVHNFTTVIDEGGTQGPLAYRLDSGPADLRAQYFRRADGKYIIALWRTASVWNRDTKAAITVSPASVSVTLPDAEAVAELKPVTGGLAGLTPTGDQFTTSVAGDPVLLLVTPES